MKRKTIILKATLKMRFVYYFVAAVSSLGLFLLSWTIAEAVLPFAIVAAALSVLALGTILTVFQKKIDGRPVTLTAKAVAWSISIMAITVSLMFLVGALIDLTGGRCPGFLGGSMSCFDFTRFILLVLTGSPAILVPFVVVAFAALVAKNTKPAR